MAMAKEYPLVIAFCAIMFSDENLKKEAAEILEDMGLNFSSAYTIFTKALVRQRRIPFEIEADPFYSKANQARILKSIKAMEAGKNIVVHELIEED